MGFQFSTLPIHLVQTTFWSSGKTKVTIHCLPFSWYFQRWGEEVQAAFEFQTVDENNKLSSLVLSKHIGSHIVASVTVFILIGVILLASFVMACPQKLDTFLACWPQYVHTKEEFLLPTGQQKTIQINIVSVSVAYSWEMCWCISQYFPLFYLGLL